MNDNGTRSQVSLLNRDFGGFKRDLIKYLQARHSGSFSDFNEASPGMALIEAVAYVGDVLSFYQDFQFNELTENAKQIDNVVAYARARGYRPSGKRASRGMLSLAIKVPSKVNSYGEFVPDDTYTPILLKGARAVGPNGSMFETLDDIHFTASNGRLVTGSNYDATTGYPTHFALRKDIEVIAGETKTETFVLSEFKRFRTVELTNVDVIEVIEVIDSDRNEWNEVDYLAQDWVFDGAVNDSTEDGDVVPYVMKLLPAARRFIIERDPVTEKTSLVFGSGDGVNFDDELIPNIADLALPLAGRRTFSSYSIDPRNFIKTRGFGLSPYNTTLTVKYRVGGGEHTNIPPKTVKNVVNATFDFSTSGLVASTKSAVEASVGCINLKKIDGGGAAETIQEIKLNAAAFFAAQDRVVTREDVVARVFSLPAKFGSPKKAFVKPSHGNGSSIDIHLLSLDSNGHLAQPTVTLKKNVKTYLKKFRMMTDGFNVMGSDIINVGCSFGIVVAKPRIKVEVVARCLDKLMEFFDTKNTEIGKPIVLSQVVALLDGIPGVVSVYDLSFSNIIGTVSGLSYSSVRYDVRASTKNGIVYCPENSIFEVKYPRRDLVGVAK